MPPGHLLLSVLVPSYALFALKKALFGRIVLAVYVICVCVFLIRLGYLSGAVAYGLMISLHACGIIYLASLWGAPTRLLSRVSLSLGMLFLTWGLLYATAGAYLQANWCRPVGIGDRVWVVNPRLDPRLIKRGDLVLHTIRAGRGEGAYIRGGLGLDPVVALPGDEVQFYPTLIMVNGKPYLRQLSMPGHGQLTLPENVWLIWPTMDITVRGRVPESTLSELAQEAAMVHREEILGKPYRSWFGRHQWP